MEERIDFYFDDKTGIFHKNYFGDVRLNDLFTSWEEVIAGNKIPPGTKKFVINYKSATILFPPKHVADIADFYNKNNHIFGGSKIAMVMETPPQVVFPRLMEEEDISFNVKTFYTLEAAINWLTE